MEFYSPKNFKQGKYYFNRYNANDLLILIPAVVGGVLLILCSIYFIMLTKNKKIGIIGIGIGAGIIFIAYLLTMSVPVYHNILGWINVQLHFEAKQKVYKWYGYDYMNYEEESEK